MKYEIEHLTVQEMIAALKVIQEALEHLPEDCGEDTEIRLDGWNGRQEVSFFEANAFYQAAAHFGVKYTRTVTSDMNDTLDFTLQGIHFYGLANKEAEKRGEARTETASGGGNHIVFNAPVQR